jgi:spermidine synthase
VIAARKSGTTAIFSCGSLLATSEDKTASEEFIHMSLSATLPGKEKDILFIGAALSGQIGEIAKYKLNSLDCVQINPLITRLQSVPGVPEKLNGKINFITADPRNYLKKTRKQYDAVLMSMPAPSNFGLNRYFTQDFFKLVYRRLKPKGIFAFSLPSKREILSPQFIKFDSSIINALDKIFPRRLIIPSDSMLLIASEENITAEKLLDNFAATGIKTDFFTLYHFQDYLDPGMRLYAENSLDPEIEPNSDLNPSGLLNYLLLEQIKFYPNFKLNVKPLRRLIILSFFLCGLFILAARKLSPRISCLLNTGSVGFSAISLSSIILVVFQLTCGGLFWKLGLLLALFMGATALGTFFTGRLKNEKTNFLYRIYLSWTLLLIILFLGLKGISGGNYAQIILFFAAFFCGFLTGSAYPLIVRQMRRNKFREKNIATTIYAADLTGAFLGSFACGLFLLPCLGITGALLALALLNAALALANSIFRES